MTTLYELHTYGHRHYRPMSCMLMNEGRCAGMESTACCTQHPITCDSGGILKKTCFILKVAKLDKNKFMKCSLSIRHLQVNKT